MWCRKRSGKTMMVSKAREPQIRAGMDMPLFECKREQRHVRRDRAPRCAQPKGLPGESQTRARDGRLADLDSPEPELVPSQGNRRRWRVECFGRYSDSRLLSSVGKMGRRTSGLNPSTGIQCRPTAIKHLGAEPGGSDDPCTFGGRALSRRS